MMDRLNIVSVNYNSLTLYSSYPSFFAGRTHCPLALVICKPQALMTKKVPKKILRIERNFFVNLRNKCFWPPTPRRAAAAADFLRPAARPPTEIDRRAAADTMTSAHSSTLHVAYWTPLLFAFHSVCWCFFYKQSHTLQSAYRPTC